MSLIYSTSIPGIVASSALYKAGLNFPSFVYNFQRENYNNYIKP